MRELTARDFAAKHCYNPCKDCGKRELGCHGSCEDYSSYRAEFKRVSNDMYQTQKKQNIANDFAFESVLKHKLKRGRKLEDL